MSARNDIGVLQPRPGALVVQTVFEQTVREFSAAVRDGGLALSCRSARRSVYVDAIPLERICQNRLSNAIKAVSVGTSCSASVRATGA